MPWQAKVTMILDHGWQQSNRQFWHMLQQDQDINQAGIRTDAVMQNTVSVMFVSSVLAQDQQSNAANEFQGQQ